MVRQLVVKGADLCNTMYGPLKHLQKVELSTQMKGTPFAWECGGSAHKCQAVGHSCNVVDRHAHQLVQLLDRASRSGMSRDDRMHCSHLRQWMSPQGLLFRPVVERCKACLAITERAI